MLRHSLVRAEPVKFAVACPLVLFGCGGEPPVRNARCGAARARWANRTCAATYEVQAGEDCATTATTRRFEPFVMRPAGSPAATAVATRAQARRVTPTIASGDRRVPHRRATTVDPCTDDVLSGSACTTECLTLLDHRGRVDGEVCCRCRQCEQRQRLLRDVRQRNPRGR